MKLAIGTDLYYRLLVKKIDSGIENDVLQKRKLNSKFKDICMGKRCFILGNGPSLKSVDLTKLKNEYVFSVNNFGMVKNFDYAQPNFHLWVDMSFFDMRDDQKYDIKELLDNYRYIARVSPVCFVPDLAYGFIKKHNLDEILDINYFTGFEIINDESQIKYDLTKPITSYTTVVQYAISIALYMGFKEIYLLGCDSTNIVSLLNCAMNTSNINMHAYEKDDVDERYKGLLKYWTMTDVFYDQYKLFLGYKKLYEFCNKKNVILMNCSSATIINEIPRKKLEEVFINENSSSCTNEVK